MRHSRNYLIAIHVGAVVMAVVILLPFAWLIISSVSPATDLVSSHVHWWPAHPTLSRYEAIFTSSAGGGDNVAANFRLAMINSLIVASVTTAISLVVGALGGYAFARLRFRLRRTSLFAFLAVYMLPPIALVIPLYLALANLHLLDSKIGLVLTYCSIVTPFCLWTMSNYYLSLPQTSKTPLASTAAPDLAHSSGWSCRWHDQGCSRRPCSGSCWRGTSSSTR
jgi:multiple sugar transport system permease protein